MSLRDGVADVGEGLLVILALRVILTKNILKLGLKRRSIVGSD